VIEDNKLVLKAKYAEAKELGEAVNVSRNRMSTPPPGHTHTHTHTHTHKHVHTYTHPVTPSRRCPRRLPTIP
jgi:hypothetical protein